MEMAISVISDHFLGEIRKNNVQILNREHAFKTPFTWEVFPLGAAIN